jgi:acyl carrier protein
MRSHVIEVDMNTGVYMNTEVDMNEVMAKAKTIISQVLNVDSMKISGKNNFVEDLGADSIDLIELIMRLEEEFNIQISREEAMQITTMQQAVAILLPKMAFPVSHQ